MTSQIGYFDTATGTYQTRDATSAEAADIAQRVAAAPAAASARIEAAIVAAVQKRLDTFAQTRGYDGVMSACTYAASPTPKFAAEGQYCIVARDATWAKVYQIDADVQAGNWPTAGAAQVPSSYDDISASLPVLVWPT